MVCFSDVGFWRAVRKEILRLGKRGFGFENSLLILAAYEGSQLLGLIRIVGDGFTVVFIQDILVFPEYQHRGIGSQLIQAVLARFSHVRQIELATDDTPKTIAFYRSQGFREMAELGCCAFRKV